MEAIGGAAFGPCTGCGCGDVRIESITPRYKAVAVRVWCRHCGRGWTVTRPVHPCPECDSDRTKVASTVGSVRHMKCEACGAGFKLTT